MLCLQFLVHVFHNVYNILTAVCLQSLWCFVTLTSRRLSYGTSGRQHYSPATSYSSVGMKSCTFTATSTPSLKVWRGKYYRKLSLIWGGVREKWGSFRQAIKFHIKHYKIHLFVYTYVWKLHITTLMFDNLKLLAAKNFPKILKALYNSDIY